MNALLVLGREGFLQGTAGTRNASRGTHESRDLEQASGSTGEKEAIIRNPVVAVTDAVAGGWPSSCIYQNMTCRRPGSVSKSKSVDRKEEKKRFPKRVGCETGVAGKPILLYIFLVGNIKYRERKVRDLEISICGVTGLRDCDHRV